MIDEYENLADYQQQVFNTLIKHSGSVYSFKIGVRELGWRTRVTLNQYELLIDPADYVRIDIREQLTKAQFDQFGRAVCGERIRRIQEDQATMANILDLLFPGLTEAQEAERLGLSERAGQIRNELKAAVAPEDSKQIESTDPMMLSLVDHWSRGHGSQLEREFADYLRRPKFWQDRLENNRHALLYTLRRRLRGIRKYYCGWSTLTSLAAGNIRYLLQLVDQSLLLHVRNGQPLSQAVAPDVQTTAAQGVGEKNLTELQGLDVEGARLTKLVLSLGRVFGVMAAQPEGHAPEVNQFYLKDISGDPVRLLEREAVDLLRSAVMNLALLRLPASKLTQDTDIREYDYMVHPIFAPFFVYSYRRKRKILLSSAQLVGLVNSPGDTIGEILKSLRRVEEEPLPDQLQLSLFGGYYHGAERPSTPD